MQLISNTNCPTTKIRAYDARDNHSYWVQKLSDGKCWMLTNLAYAGDGDTTYGDTTTLTIISPSTAADVSTKQVITAVGGAAVTTEPTNPSTTTGIGGQYGYMYNWCAAMGGQSATCQDTAEAQPNPGANTGAGANNNLNICPKGWRIPTGGPNSEFVALNNSVNSGSTSSDAGLRSTWLGVYGGANFNGTFNVQNVWGVYLASTRYNAAQPFNFDFRAQTVRPSSSCWTAVSRMSARCIAN